MSDVVDQSNDIAPPCKKTKKDEQNGSSVAEIELKLNDFVPHKILNNNTNRKTVCVTGSFQNKSGVALVLLEKKAFCENQLDSSGYFSEETELHTLFKNDIYGSFECYTNPKLNGVKTTIIYPATEKHIAKYCQQIKHLIIETPECYEKFTLPYLEKEQFNLQWLFNILEGKSEQERVIHDNKCEKEGFVLLPDLKWDGVSKETLYLLALVRPRNLKSLRDLDKTHLPLLKRVRNEGKKAIFDKYKVPGSQLRIYLHYQPSFYHLHIHFSFLQHEAVGIYAEKSHLLDTVINNIEMMSDYYKKASLPFTVNEMDNLFRIYETNGYVNKVISDEMIDK